MNKKDKGVAGSSKTRTRMNTKSGSGATGARSIKERPKTSARANTRANSRSHTRANTHAPRKQKSGGGVLGYIIVTLLTFGTIVSDMTGPFQGWLRPAKAAEEPKQEVMEAPKKEIPKAPKAIKKSPLKTETPKKVEEEPAFKANISANLTAEEVEEADEEKLKRNRYEDLYAKFKKEVKTPPMNKRVLVQMISGQKMYCQVVEIDKGQLSLEKIEPYNGKMKVSASKLSDKSREMFFGDEFAKVKARKMVAAEERAGFFKKDPATESGFFNPELEETPPKLVHAVQEVGTWLNLQASRGSGSGVTRLGAKINGQGKILYVYVGKSFFLKTKNEKAQWLEAVRQFWVLRCKSNSLASEANAHVCLVLDGRNVIVGGTKETDSKKIWLKKTRR